MIIKEIMTPEPEIVSPDTRLPAIASLMRDLDVGMIPVCDGERLKGMISDRDIVLRAVAEGRNPNDLSAADVMTAEVIYCFEDQTVHEAAEVMERQQIRRLVILDRDKRLTGILSLGDIAGKGGDTGETGKVLAEISEPAR